MSLTTNVSLQRAWRAGLSGLLSRLHLVAMVSATLPGCGGEGLGPGNTLAAAGTAFVITEGDSTFFGYVARDRDGLAYGGSLGLLPAYPGNIAITITDARIAGNGGSPFVIRGLQTGRTTISIRGDTGTDTATVIVVPRETPSLTANGVSVGGQHACATSVTSGLQCWGSSWYGELGNGTTRPLTAVMSPVPPRGAAGFTTVSAGISHTCALDAQGFAWCWGSNNLGEVRPGEGAVQPAPIRVSDALRFSSISSAIDHTCAGTAQLEFHCWGRGYSGVARLVPPSGTRFTSVSGGLRHTCALDDAGAIWCRGDGTLGQLGQGAFTSSDTFVKVRSDLVFTELSSGTHHNCALTNTGQVACWGRGFLGALGNGSEAAAPEPVVVGLPRPAVSVDAGTMHSCAVLDNGEGWCWGRNSRGELGKGRPPGATPIATDFRETRPVAVATTIRFTAISAGSDQSTCGLALDQRVFCWGNNTIGGLGIGQFLIDPLLGIPVHWTPVETRFAAGR